MMITFKDHESMNDVKKSILSVKKPQIEGMIDLIIDAIKESDKII